MKAIRDQADMIFTTTTLAGSRFMRQFVAICNIACVDEWACCTELETFIGWQGDMPLIVAADFEQIPLTVFSADAKDEGGIIVNSFVPQLQVSFIRRLQDMDWPYVDLTEQRRMPPGLFDPANFCIYFIITMAVGITILEARFELARKAETWSKTLSADGIYAKDPTARKLLPKRTRSPRC